MNVHEISSLVFGFVGCLGIIFSFCCQLYTIYQTKDASGTSWGLIILQLLASLCLGISAVFNIYLDGILNIPFLITNGVVFILFLVMSGFKRKFDAQQNVNE